MLYLALFWLIAAVVIGGQALLIHSAWRLARRPPAPPAGVPQSDGRADLAWTLLTALATLAMLYLAYTTIG